jgi:hypothetical protein
MQKLAIDVASDPMKPVGFKVGFGFTKRPSHAFVTTKTMTNLIREITLS